MEPNRKGGFTFYSHECKYGPFPLIAAIIRIPFSQKPKWKPSTGDISTNTKESTTGTSLTLSISNIGTLFWTKRLVSPLLATNSSSINSKAEKGIYMIWMWLLKKVTYSTPMCSGTFYYTNISWNYTCLHFSSAPFVLFIDWTGQKHLPIQSDNHLISFMPILLVGYLYFIIISSILLHPTTFPHSFMRSVPIIFLPSKSRSIIQAHKQQNLIT